MADIAMTNKERVSKLVRHLQSKPGDPELDLDQGDWEYLKWMMTVHQWFQEHGSRSTVINMMQNYQHSDGNSYSHTTAYKDFNAYIEIHGNGKLLRSDLLIGFLYEKFLSYMEKAGKKHDFRSVAAIGKNITKLIEIAKKDEDGIPPWLDDIGHDVTITFTPEMLGIKKADDINALINKWLEKKRGSKNETIEIAEEVKDESEDHAL